MYTYVCMHIYTKNMYNVYSLVLVLRKYLAFFGGRHLGAFSVGSPWHSMASRGQTPLVVTAQGGAYRWERLEPHVEQVPGFFPVDFEGRRPSETWKLGRYTWFPNVSHISLAGKSIDAQKRNCTKGHQIGAKARGKLRKNPAENDWKINKRVFLYSENVIGCYWAYYVAACLSFSLCTSLPLFEFLAGMNPSSEVIGHIGSCAKAYVYYNDLWLYDFEKARTLISRAITMESVTSCRTFHRETIKKIWVCVNIGYPSK